MLIIYYLILLIIAIIPVAGLLVFIYFQDKYQKEPIGSLCKAFFGGFLSVPMDIILVTFFIEFTFGLIPIFNQTAFYNAFFCAGIPEELCKFIIFMIFIWRDKNFDEFFDGIVYATFISLGFACVENVKYVLIDYPDAGIYVGISRALTAVPGHMLFGILMGYFLSLAKFNPKKRALYIILGLLIAMIGHGLYDWLCFFPINLIETFGDNMYAIIMVLALFAFFIVFYVVLWIIGIVLIRKHQKKSKLQAEAAITNNTTN